MAFLWSAARSGALQNTPTGLGARAAFQARFASSGYFELGMFDDAAVALEESKPYVKPKTRV
jgi:hypothetical protein